MTKTKVGIKLNLDFRSLKSIVTFEMKVLKYPSKKGLDAIGQLETSALELNVVSSADDGKFIIGEWAEVKVSPIDNVFYQNFRYEIFTSFMDYEKLLVWQSNLVILQTMTNPKIFCLFKISVKLKKLLR